MTLRTSRPDVFLRKDVMKRCRKISRRAPMPKWDLNKVAKQLEIPLRLGVRM